jgi:hypothetical protein
MKLLSLNDPEPSAFHAHQVDPDQGMRLEIERRQISLEKLQSAAESRPQPYLFFRNHEEAEASPQPASQQSVTRAE